MLLVTLVSVVLLFNAPQLSQAQFACTQEIDVDYFGNDLLYVFVQNVGACCNLCSVYPGCQSWTFVTSANACWLKSSANPTKFNASFRISGLRSNGTIVTTAAPLTTAATTTAATTTAATTTAAATVTVPVIVTTVATLTTPTTPATVTTTATTAAALTTRSFGCFIENDINYPGNDLSSQFVNSIGDCCNLCGATAGCQAWVYWADFKFCYLKSSLPVLSQRQAFTNMFAGIIALQ